MPNEKPAQKKQASGGFPGRGPGRGPGHHIKAIVKPKDTKATIKRLWTYLAGSKLLLILVLCLVLVSVAANLAGPYLLGLSIDALTQSAPLTVLAKYAGLMILFYLVNAVFTWGQTYFMANIAQDTVLRLRKDLFEHVQTLSLRYFDTHPHGDLMSRMTNDIDNVSNTLTQSITQLISSVITITGVLIVMLRLNWILALVTIATVPLIFLIVSRVIKRTRKAFKEQQRFLGNVNSLIEEYVSGQKVVKAYVQEDAIIERFDQDNDKLKGAAVRAQFFGGIMGPLMAMTNNLTYALVVGVGGLLVLQGRASLGIIASFMNYSRQFGRPLNQVAQLYNTVQSAIAGAERVFEVLDETPEVEEHDQAISVEALKGSVAFSDVDFHYVENKPVLRSVSFDASPGEIIALVGPTGAGKTTIINLLTRFYDIQAGDILIDGKPIERLKKEELRQRLGIVLQDPYLFSGTIYENIRYGRLDATEEEIIEAAKLANAHSFIHRLPDGYHTSLTEEGGNLSQGQKQLISIARAILSDPDILILDEATSSVDTRTEFQIQKGMKTLMKGRTSFVIAHRLSTIRNADQILVIQEGRIIERGTHQSLLEERGFYHQLYTSQFETQLA